MSELFASGHVIDGILAITLIESVVLIVYFRTTGRGVAPADFLVNLLSGAALLVATRTALVGAWWGWTGFWLAAAFAAHLTDLGRRWHA